MLENKRTFNAVNANETMRGDLLILEFSFGQFTISCITFWKRFGHVLKPFCRKDRKCISFQDQDQDSLIFMRNKIVH